jgi:hypothetical protein
MEVARDLGPFEIFGIANLEKTFSFDSFAKITYLKCFGRMARESISWDPLTDPSMLYECILA